MNVFNYDFIGPEDLKLIAETKKFTTPKSIDYDSTQVKRVEVCEACCKVL